MSTRDSDNSGSGGSNRQALPPIRTVLGEQLDLPTAPSPYSPHSASSHSSVHASSWEINDREDAWQKSSNSSSGSRRGGSQMSPSRSGPPTVANRYLPSHPETTFSLPPSFLSLPASPSPYSPSSTRDQGGVSPSADPQVSPWTQPVHPNSAPPYSYSHVLRPSPSGELITAPSLSRRAKRRPATTTTTNPASREQATSSTTANTENAMNMRRHVCPTCQKRFNRPSSLRTHQSVHTGSRPFTCPHPGCSRTFSVASNMRRHLRKHKDTTPGQDLETGQDSFGSSDGELEVDPGEEPGPAPVPSGLPLEAPGTYFEWPSKA